MSVAEETTRRGVCPSLGGGAGGRLELGALAGSLVRRAPLYVRGAVKALHQCWAVKMVGSGQVGSAWGYLEEANNQLIESCGTWFC